MAVLESPRTKDKADDDDEGPLLQITSRGADAPKFVARKATKLGVVDIDQTCAVETLEDGASIVLEFKSRHGTFCDDEHAASDFGGPELEALWGQDETLGKQML